MQKEQAAREVGLEMVLQEPPVGDHRSNGLAENAVRKLKRQVRILRSSLEPGLVVATQAACGGPHVPGTGRDRMLLVMTVEGMKRGTGVRRLAKCDRWISDGWEEPAVPAGSRSFNRTGKALGREWTEPESFENDGEEHD